MTDHQQAAIEAAEDALRADIWDGDPEDIPPTMGREAELAVAAALPAIEKQIREQVAADIWEYWDACGDLIDDRDSARQAIDAIAAQIAKGADHA